MMSGANSFRGGGGRRPLLGEGSDKRAAAAAAAAAVAVADDDEDEDEDGDGDGDVDGWDDGDGHVELAGGCLGGRLARAAADSPAVRRPVRDAVRSGAERRPAGGGANEAQLVLHAPAQAAAAAPAGRFNFASANAGASWGRRRLRANAGRSRRSVRSAHKPSEWKNNFPFSLLRLQRRHRRHRRLRRRLAPQLGRALRAPVRRRPPKVAACAFVCPCGSARAGGWQAARESCERIPGASFSLALCVRAACETASQRPAAPPPPAAASRTKGAAESTAGGSSSCAPCRRAERSSSGCGGSTNNIRSLARSPAARV